MSRRHRAEKREIIPDPKFGDVIVTKFMNSIMYDGKKSVAERIVYGAFDIIESRTKNPPLEVFKQALDNVAPAIEVRSTMVLSLRARAAWISQRMASAWRRSWRTSTGTW